MTGRRQPHRFLFISAPFGGIEVYVKNLQRILSDRADILSEWVYIDSDLSDAKVNRLPRFSNWTLKGGWASRERVSSLEKSGKTFDAVMCNHLIPPVFLGSFARRVPMVLSLDGTPSILSEMRRWYQGANGWIKDTSRRLKKSLDRRVYRRSAGIFAWSNTVRRSLVEDYDFPEPRVKVLPPGVDLSLWQAPMREEGSSDGPVRVLFVGGDFERKGGDLVFKLAALEEFSDMRFDVVTGAVPQNAPPNVIVHTGLRPNSAPLVELYRRADVFLLPTRADLCPTNAITEAMASGLPVLTTLVGGLDEMVEEDKTGFVVGVDDFEAMVRRLRLLSADGAKRRAFGGAGRARVESGHDLAKNAATLVDEMKMLADRFVGAHVNS